MILKIIKIRIYLEVMQMNKQEANEIAERVWQIIEDSSAYS